MIGALLFFIDLVITSHAITSEYSLVETGTLAKLVLCRSALAVRRSDFHFSLLAC